MMTVKVPVDVLQFEVVQLAQSSGEGKDRLNPDYARGAIDALTWILSGAKAPSEGGSTSIPVTCEGALYVH